MKKLIFLLAFAFIGLMVYSQDSTTINAGVTDLEVVGSALHNLGGDSKKTAYTKINAIFAVVDTLYSGTVAGTVTDGTPTAAQIAAALDISVASAIGKVYRILDSSGTKLVYWVTSDGTNWFFIATTQAS